MKEPVSERRELGRPLGAAWGRTALGSRGRVLHKTNPGPTPEVILPLGESSGASLATGGASSLLHPLRLGWTQCFFRTASQVVQGLGRRAIQDKISKIYHFIWDSVKKNIRGVKKKSHFFLCPWLCSRRPAAVFPPRTRTHTRTHAHAHTRTHTAAASPGEQAGCPSAHSSGASMLLLVDEPLLASLLARCGGTTTARGSEAFQAHSTVAENRSAATLTFGVPVETERSVNFLPALQFRGLWRSPGQDAPTRQQGQHGAASPHTRVGPLAPGRCVGRTRTDSPTVQMTSARSNGETTWPLESRIH